MYYQAEKPFAAQGIRYLRTHKVMSNVDNPLWVNGSTSPILRDSSFSPSKLSKLRMKANSVHRISLGVASGLVSTADVALSFDTEKTAR